MALERCAFSLAALCGMGATVLLVQRSRTDDSSLLHALNSCRQLSHLLEEYRADHSSYPQHLTGLVSEGYVSSDGLKKFSIRADKNSPATPWIYHSPGNSQDLFLSSPRAMSVPNQPDRWIYVKADGQCIMVSARNADKIPDWVTTGLEKNRKSSATTE